MLFAKVAGTIRNCELAELVGGLARLLKRKHASAVNTIAE